MTTIFEARKILTMSATRPVATHVAVRDGKILGAGTLEELERWDDYTLDTTFADKVLMPGLVEGHAHSFEGLTWDDTYVGWFDRRDPDGKTWDGVQTIDALVDRMSASNAANPGTDVLVGWGLDPIYMENTRVTRQDLDRISTDRPILIVHASGHMYSLNSRAFEMLNMLKPGMNAEGIPLADDGLPMGELRGLELMVPASVKLGYDRMSRQQTPGAMDAFARLCVRAGVTTCADLARMLDDDQVAALLRDTGAPDYPVCIVPYMHINGRTTDDLFAFLEKIIPQSTDRCRFGAIKAHADGSIQGFTGRLNWPYYQNGAPNGMWYVTPEKLGEVYERALQAGILVHTHTNGDEASQLAIELTEAALKKHPSFDHRFTLQHCQMATPAQFRKIKALGMCVNLFANHHYFWGDEHYKYTVGPERAERMNACRTALDTGVPMAIHSDAPVTPLGPLFTAWAAVTRRTASNRVQGTGERITVDEALSAITLGAAFTMGMDHLVGSIEAGKRADFCVLGDDPTDVAPEALKDIPIWGTVQGGRLFAAETI
ncbi:amidohydrolase [Chachezhania antarctica]|uniref:amidohydrolase n=1 Tax=Chachezhania antarctica TaxID=2340860 RepID=UPI000EB04841|nr:amidohydrolase [Chachezhania antarctica]|tara:strand:- start:717 stop:2351 length:1635 start_codon:yes stop_codon:yes gene_type:complete